MLTFEQKKMFEELLESENFTGKKSLRHLLWLNTVEPKHKVGDCFLVTEPGHRIYNRPVKNFRGKIIKIRTFIDQEEFFYTLEGVVRCGDRECSVRYNASEADLCQPCEDNITILESGDVNAGNCIDIPFTTSHIERV